jgi:hypothetical protein
MLVAFVYLITGYQIVLAIHRLSELGQAIAEGRVVFQEPAT